MNLTKPVGGPPPAASAGPGGARPKTGGKTAAGILADATASLAPFHTPFAHRPEWQGAADDAADEQRERSREA